MKPIILDMISQRKPKSHISTTLKVVPLTLNNWLKANSDVPATWHIERANKGRSRPKPLDGSCQLIIDLLCQGVSHTEIARRFNVGIGVVRYWLKAHPDVIPPLSHYNYVKLDRNRQLICDEFGRGATRVSIAQMLNVSRPTLSRWLEKNPDVIPPLSRYNYGKLDRNRQLICDEFSRGATRGSIAQMLNVSSPTLYRWLKAHPDVASSARTDNNNNQYPN